MRLGASPAGWAFRAAVAVSSAALTDPIVERLSNAGVFGNENFTDRSSSNVVPALGIAALLSLAFVALAVRRAFAGHSDAPKWMQTFVSDIGACPLRVHVYSIYVLQIGALFCMESLEQLAVNGHLLGGAVWLGAPALCSLLLHLLGCIAVTWMLSRLLSTFTRTIVEVVRGAIDVLFRLMRDPQAPVVLHYHSLPAPRIQLYSRQLHERAPPLAVPV